jgi:exodeoxyribonuclease VII small subunit
VSQSTEITFEAGYRRLQDIAERLGSDEVPVHEMCDLFAEGKGLEQALGDDLAQQKERVEAIERGEGMRAFRVVPPGGAAAAEVAARGAAAQAASGAAGEAAAAVRGAAAEPAPTDSVAADEVRAERNGDAPSPPPQDEVLPF